MKRINFAHLKQHMYCYQCSSMKICLLPVFLVFTSPDVIWLSCVFAACLFLGWVWLTYFIPPRHTHTHTHTPIPDPVWVFIFTSCSIHTWSLQPLFVSTHAVVYCSRLVDILLLFLGLLTCGFFSWALSVPPALLCHIQRSSQPALSFPDLLSDVQFFDHISLDS